MCVCDWKMVEGVQSWTPSVFILLEQYFAHIVYVLVLSQLEVEVVNIYRLWYVVTNNNCLYGAISVSPLQELEYCIFHIFPG